MFKQSATRVWGVVRIVDGQLCFAQPDGAFAPLDDDTAFFAARNDAFNAAQECRGLVCLVDERLAAAYALSATWWPHNAIKDASSGLAVVSGGAS